MKLKIGKRYKVNHNRKGIFTGTLITLDDEWATIVSENFIEGMRNDVEPGEEVICRRSFCTFEELP